MINVRNALTLNRVRLIHPKTGYNHLQYTALCSRVNTRARWPLYFRKGKKTCSHILHNILFLSTVFDATKYFEERFLRRSLYVYCCPHSPWRFDEIQFSFILKCCYAVRTTPCNRGRIRISWEMCNSALRLRDNYFFPSAPPHHPRISVIGSRGSRTKIFYLWISDLSALSHAVERA